MITVGVLGFIKDKLSSRIGAGDISTLAWLVPGLVVLDVYLLPIFLISVGVSLFGARLLRVERFPGMIGFFLGLIIVFLAHFLLFV